MLKSSCDCQRSTGLFQNLKNVIFICKQTFHGCLFYMEWKKFTVSLKHLWFLNESLRVQERFLNHTYGFVNVDGQMAATELGLCRF